MTDESNEFGGGQFGGQFSSDLSASFKKLIDDTLAATGINIDDVGYRKRALVWANYVQLAALKGRHWRFLNKELFIDLQAPYSAGTIALTQGLPDVVEDLATDAVPVVQWNSNHIGAKFCVTGRDQESYRVLKLPTSKKMEISAAYAGNTVANGSYKILFDRYSLDAKVQTVRSLVISGIGEIKPLGLQKFRFMEALDPCRTGYPEYYTIVNQEADTGQSTIEFYPAPDKRYAARIEYTELVTTPEDTETCYSVIPPQHMDVLFYGVAAEISRYQNNPTATSEYKGLYLESWRRFSSDQDMVDSVARIQHGRKYFTRRQRHRGFFGLRWFGRVED